MHIIKQILLYFKPFQFYYKGKEYLNDPIYKECRRKDEKERNKNPSRTEIINFILSQFNRETLYLEIGVRNPDDNFNHIKAAVKYSVDPGVEYEENPVDFKLASDAFFKKLRNSEILSDKMKFDVIFVDGLHLADQVDRDVINAMNFIKEDGFIVLHDCNPPTEWHARSDFSYGNTPAHGNWNGTTWKAFLKWRSNPLVQSCCIDSDWGVGVLSRKHSLGDPLETKSQFYEYKELEAHRKTYLNLLDFEDFKRLFVK